VAREGEPCNGVLFIVSGRLRLVRQGRGGKAVTLGTLGPGEVLGGAMPPRVTQNASARASEDAIVARWASGVRPGADSTQRCASTSNAPRTGPRFTSSCLATPLGSLPVSQTLLLADQLVDRTFEPEPHGHRSRWRCGPSLPGAIREVHAAGTDRNRSPFSARATTSGRGRC
jgi:hypothetical protein